MTGVAWKSTEQMIPELSSIVLLVALICGAWLVIDHLHIETGRDYLGLGDIKLIGALAFWVGPLHIAPALLIASSTALVFIGVTKRFREAIPFAPFISMGFLIVWIHENAEVLKASIT